ncbi:antirestriction protein ArdA [Hyphococcus luteus]|uniref:Antirestriction protein ArdA n=1 Tax=Hyphococcus luteus TaxID=2058213 RepID=A0A2S7K5C8_9PROT|nr:antirestriction protein ArdA [Marinicaulis flavus]PQA87681.1 antirestriction protein ArdA [Marinicaulis flavus]
MCEETETGTPAENPAPHARDHVPRIYVACLASYNAGVLHGRWIDVTDPDEIRAQVAAMLSASPEPDAEEWAIHDYEGFEGAEISEYAGFDQVCDLAAFIEEHGALGGKLVAHFCGDLDEARAAFEDYAGEYKSLEDFAYDFTEQTGVTIPDSLALYIDYEAMGRDIELNGDVFTIETGFEEVHIFWAR